MTAELTPGSVHKDVANALGEDVGTGDLTAGLVDESTLTGAQVIAREPMIIAGRPWFDEVFRQLDERVIVDWYIDDGRDADTNDVICKLVGPARAILSGERTALNFLQTLSATATQTARYVAAIEGTRARLLDTRKTLPGLRLAQKYAVRQGGGHNHRIGLFDAILVKENHIKAAGGIAEVLQKTAGIDDEVLVEIEVESLAEMKIALDAGATRILLDNFSLDELREAVRTNAGYGYVAAELEASGNVTLDTIRDIAETGVDFISTGAITKNVAASDLSMLFSID
jgi:nicotinate-nucleotide pyrophosphorylase (carboxylating)